jgi:hypothetical protein
LRVLGIPNWKIPNQPSALDPWREVGRLEGLFAVKGALIPWVVQVVGKEWWIGTIVGVEPRFWVANYGEWKTSLLLVDS